jgi:hypothetical protein
MHTAARVGGRIGSAICRGAGILHCCEPERCWEDWKVARNERVGGPTVADRRNPSRVWVTRRRCRALVAGRDLEDRRWSTQSPKWRS